MPLVGDGEISSLEPLVALRCQGLRALSLCHHLRPYGRTRVKGPIFHQPHQDTDIYIYIYVFLKNSIFFLLQKLQGRVMFLYPLWVGVRSALLFQGERGTQGS